MDDRINSVGDTTASSPEPSDKIEPEIQPQATSRGEIPNSVVKPEYLGEEADYIDCPHCESRQKTVVSHPDSDATVLAGAFCCLCCGIILFWVPCACHWFADTDHKCSKCHNLVAHKPHDGKMEPILPVADQRGISMYAPIQPMKSSV